MPFAIASMLVRGRLSLEDVMAEPVLGDDLLEAVEKVRVRVRVRVSVSVRVKVRVRCAVACPWRT